MNIKEHLLACLSEECGEVLHAIGKIQRFGPDDLWPAVGVTNAEQLELELLDLVAVVELLREYKVIRQPIGARDKIEAKKTKVRQMMEYAKGRGTLTEHP